MNNFIKPFALVMALTIPAIASADITAKNVTVGEVRITYTTADAASSYGRKELESQIRRAAKKVCGAQNFQRYLTSPLRGSLRQNILKGPPRKK